MLLVMRRHHFLLILWVLLLSPVCRAEVVVVVDARSSVMRLSQDEVTNIFLGRYRQYPDGDVAFPVDQPKSSTVRADFYQRLVGKSPAEINAYWARLYFSGNMRPPVMAGDSSAILVT